MVLSHTSGVTDFLIPSPSGQPDGEVITTSGGKYILAPEGGSPGGSSGSIQYNNAGTLGGFGSYNSSTSKVTLPGAADVTGELQALGQLLVQGVLTTNNTANFNGAATAFSTFTVDGGLQVNSGTTLNGPTVFLNNFTSGDNNFYYDYSAPSLSIGNEDNSATFVSTSNVTTTTPDPSSISGGLIQVVGAPTSASIAQDASGNFYTANGTTYTAVILSMDASTGNISGTSSQVSFTDSNDGSLFQIDFSWAAPFSEPNGISQYLIGLSTDGGATYHYRLTGSSATSFDDNDGNYPYSDLTSFTQYVGYTANGSTLGITYNLYNYQTVGITDIYSTGSFSISPNDPNNGNDYIVSIPISAANNWKIVRSGNQTGAHIGTGSSVTVIDQQGAPWSDSSTITPTSYVKPAGKFVGGGGIISDGYMASDETPGASATVNGLTFKEGLYTSGSSLTGIVNSVTNTDGTLNASPTTGAVSIGVNQGHNFTWTGNSAWTGDSLFGASGTAIYPIQLAFGSNGVLAIPHATGAIGGTLRFMANTGTGAGRSWDMSSDQFANGDFVLRLSASNSTDPTIPVFYANNAGNITIGATTNTGSPFEVAYNDSSSNVLPGILVRDTGNSQANIAVQGGTSGNSYQLQLSSQSGGASYLQCYSPGLNNYNSFNYLGSTHTFFATPGSFGSRIPALTIAGNANLGGPNVTSPTDFLHLPASTTSFASLRIPAGTAPSSPNDGAVWQNGSHLYAQINSASRQLDQQVIAGSFSATGAATTSFTVTIGSTQPGTTYKVVVTPTSLLGTTSYYISAKTTTTFTITYISALTGAVSFDWGIFQ